MRSIFRELYDTEIDLDINRLRTDYELVALYTQRENSKKELMELLDDKGKEIFETYMKAESAFANKIRYKSYAKALKSGALFMAEILAGGEYWLEKITNESEEDEP